MHINKKYVKYINDHENQTAQSHIKAVTQNYVDFNFFKINWPLA